MAKDRANDSRRVPNIPSVKDVANAYLQGNVTMEEAHDLNPDIAKKGREHNGTFYPEYPLHSEDKISGKMQRSEERARQTHKNAGLSSKGDW